MPEITKKFLTIDYDYDEVCRILVAHARNNIKVIEAIGTDFEVNGVSQDEGDFYIEIHLTIED